MKQDLLITPRGPQTFMGSVNLPSSPVSLTVANPGDVPTGDLDVEVTGANASHFVVTSTCTSLAPLATCNVTVVFKPTSDDPTGKTATIVVTDLASVASTVSLVGFTPLPENSLVITPTGSDLAPIPFGTSLVPTTSFTVTNPTNSSTGPLAVNTSNAEFLVLTDNCRSKRLATNESCILGVTVHAFTAGAKSAILTVTSGTHWAVKTLTATIFSRMDAGVASPADAGFVFD